MRIRFRFDISERVRTFVVWVLFPGKHLDAAFFVNKLQGSIFDSSSFAKCAYHSALRHARDCISLLLSLLPRTVFKREKSDFERAI